jgi:cell division septal protein FtsQ
MRKQQAVAEMLNPRSLAKRLVTRPANRPSAASATAMGRAAWQAVGRVRFNWRWLAIVPILALIVYGVAQLFTDYQFYVYTADIQGNQRVPSQAIYDASGVDQKSIFWVNGGQVEKRVAALPGIASASVRVRLPNRVTISVQERAPLVAWQVGGSDVWIATDGAPMPIAGTPPVLTLIDADSVAADLQPTDASAATAPISATLTAASPRLRTNVFTALVALHARYPDVTNVYYGRQEGLYFRAPEGWTVFLGDTGDIAGRLALLESARPRIAAQSVPPEVVDLRVDNNAYLR